MIVNSFRTLGSNFYCKERTRFFSFPYRWGSLLFPKNELVLALPCRSNGEQNNRMHNMGKKSGVLIFITRILGRYSPWNEIKWCELIDLNMRRIEWWCQRKNNEHYILMNLRKTNNILFEGNRTPVIRSLSKRLSISLSG